MVSTMPSAGATGSSLLAPSGVSVFSTGGSTILGGAGTVLSAGGAAGVPTAIGTGIVPGSAGSYSALAGNQVPGLAAVTPGIATGIPGQPLGFSAPVISAQLVDPLGQATITNFQPIQYNSAAVPGAPSPFAGAVPMSGFTTQTTVR